MCKIKCFTLESQAKKKGTRKLRSLQKKMKGMSNKWAPMVLAEMNKVEPTNKFKMYNILNGGVTDKRWHAIFINAANIVIKQLEEETKIV